MERIDTKIYEKKPKVVEDKAKYIEQNKKNIDEYYRILDKMCISNFKMVDLAKYLPFSREYLYQLLKGESQFKDSDLRKVTLALTKYRADNIKGKVKK